jgi:cytidylate kinase
MAVITISRQYGSEGNEIAANLCHLKRFSGVDWSDALLYHLIINTGRWSIEAASRLIVQAVSQLQPLAALN